MRKNWKTWLLAGVALVIGFLELGCEAQAPQTGGKVGTLMVRVGLRSNKTLWPEGWIDAIGTYNVYIYAHDADLDVEVPLITWEDIAADSLVEPVVFSDIEYGTYIVIVEGFCGEISQFCHEASTIAQGESGRDVVIDSQVTDIDVTVRPLLQETVSGSMEIILRWPAGQEVDWIAVDTKGVDDEDDWQEIGDFSVFDVEGDWLFLVLDEGEVTMGSSMIRFTLYDAQNDPITTVIEVVNIYSNFKTINTITLRESDFSRP